MSKIRGKDTAPEILIRKHLFSQGFRYRLHSDNLPGKPDIVLPKYRTVIFVHGCFWHGHSGCKSAKLPETNTEKWRRKISANVERDRKNIRLLEDDGWHVIIVWQCEIRSKGDREVRLKALSKEIREDITKSQ